MAYPLWYVEEEQRRSWPPAAATNSLPLGWADLASPRRVVHSRCHQGGGDMPDARASGLVVCVLASSTPHSSRALRGSQLGPAQGTGG